MRRYNDTYISVLKITDIVIVPINSDEYSLSGLSNLVKIINDIKLENRDLKIGGVFITKYQKCKIDKKIELFLSENLNVFLKNNVRNTVKFKEASIDEKLFLQKFGNRSFINDYYKLVEEIFKGVI